MKTSTYNLVLVLITIIFIGCQNNSSDRTEIEEKIIVEDKTVEVDNLSDQLAIDFLKLFEKVEINQNQALLVETTTEQGKRILPKFDTLFFDIPISSKESVMESDGYIYAVNHFQYNDELEALIIRHYGEYSPNRLSLFLWDKNKNAFLKQEGIELSIFFGDEEWTKRVSSIVTDYNQDGEIDILIRTNEQDNEPEGRVVLKDDVATLKLEGSQFVKEQTSNEEGFWLWTKALEATNQISLVDREVKAITDAASVNESIPFLFSPFSIGSINANTSIWELREKFVGQVLEDVILYDYEDIAVAATKINFENSANNLSVIWKDDKKDNPLEIRIENKAAEWQTEEGVKMGSTIEEVQAANNKPFLIYGFEIDNDLAGSVQNWQEGNLHPLWLQFEYTNDLPFDEFEHIMGSEGIASDHPIIQKTGLVVKAIKIQF